MKFKTFIKKSPLFPILIYLRYSLPMYLRYLVNRYFINLRFKNSEIKPGSSINSVAPKGVFFFGYYNITPANRNNEILFLSVKKALTRGSLYEPAKIMLRDSKGTIKVIAKTKSWNWQQGCMLQWFPGEEHLILFNDYEEDTDQYVSKIIDPEGSLVRQYSIPVYNVSKYGRFALSLNYDRLAQMRPDYGYFNRKGSTLPTDNLDGIWYLDLETGHSRLIISLAQLKELSYDITMEGAMHKVNHIDINPSGSRFMFLHRWMGPNGRYMRLVTANPDGSDIYILNGDEMTSHCCWLDSINILSFCKVKEEIGYFKFQDKTKKVRLFSENMPETDGHPSISPDGKWIVTDTYPDQSRMAYIYLYQFDNDQIIKLGHFFQPLRYKGEKRIDLHPKWSTDGGSIFFESGHQRKRKLYKIDLSFILLNICNKQQDTAK